MAKLYDTETSERAVWLFLKFRGKAPESLASACFERVYKLVRIPIDTMCGSVKRAEFDAGKRSGAITGESEELKRFRHENVELKRANEILKTASACFAAVEFDCSANRSSRASIPTGHHLGSRRSVAL